jgi:hypothetical protein
MPRPVKERIAKLREEIAQIREANREKAMNYGLSEIPPVRWFAVEPTPQFSAAAPNSAITR